MRISCIFIYLVIFLVPQLLPDPLLSLPTNLMLFLSLKKKKPTKKHAVQIVLAIYSWEPGLP